MCTFLPLWRQKRRTKLAHRIPFCLKKFKWWNMNLIQPSLKVKRFIQRIPEKSCKISANQIRLFQMPTLFCWIKTGDALELGTKLWCLRTYFNENTEVSIIAFRFCFIMSALMRKASLVVINYNSRCSVVYMQTWHYLLIYILRLRPILHRPHAVEQKLIKLG